MALMAWGPIQFEVYPLNFHALDHGTDTDWARHEIAGGAIHREWVGENDEEITLKGRVFPHHRIGGLSELEALESLRRSGAAGQLIRGDGRVMGWYVIEQLHRGHTFIGADGVGKIVEFEAKFARIPAPPAESYFPTLYQTVMV